MQKSGEECASYFVAPFEAIVSTIFDISVEIEELFDAVLTNGLDMSRRLFPWQWTSLREQTHIQLREKSDRTEREKSEGRRIIRLYNTSRTEGEKRKCKS